MTPHLEAVIGATPPRVRVRCCRKPLLGTLEQLRDLLGDLCDCRSEDREQEILDALAERLRELMLVLRSIGLDPSAELAKEMYEVVVWLRERGRGRVLVPVERIHAELAKGFEVIYWTVDDLAEGRAKEAAYALEVIQALRMYRGAPICRLNVLYAPDLTPFERYVKGSAAEFAQAARQYRPHVLAAICAWIRCARAHRRAAAEAADELGALFDRVSEAADTVERWVALKGAKAVLEIVHEPGLVRTQVVVGSLLARVDIMMRDAIEGQPTVETATLASSLLYYIAFPADVDPQRAPTAAFLREVGRLREALPTVHGGRLSDELLGKIEEKLEAAISHLDVYSQNRFTVGDEHLKAAEEILGELASVAAVVGLSRLAAELREAYDSVVRLGDAVGDSEHAKLLDSMMEHIARARDVLVAVQHRGCEIDSEAEMQAIVDEHTRRQALCAAEETMVSLREEIIRWSERADAPYEPIATAARELRGFSMLGLPAPAVAMAGFVADALESGQFVDVENREIDRRWAGVFEALLHTLECAREGDTGGIVRALEYGRRLLKGLGHEVIPYRPGTTAGRATGDGEAANAGDATVCIVPRPAPAASGDGQARGEAPRERPRPEEGGETAGQRTARQDDGELLADGTSEAAASRTLGPAVDANAQETAPLDAAAPPDAGGAAAVPQADAAGAAAETPDTGGEDEAAPEMAARAEAVEAAAAAERRPAPPDDARAPSAACGDTTERAAPGVACESGAGPEEADDGWVVVLPAPPSDVPPKDEDEELGSIFADEVSGQIVPSMRRALERLRADPASPLAPLESLQSLFHTLKGSAGLIEAKAIQAYGEFANALFKGLIRHVRRERTWHPEQTLAFVEQAAQVVEDAIGAYARREDSAPIIARARAPRELLALAGLDEVPVAAAPPAAEPEAVEAAPGDAARDACEADASAGSADTGIFVEELRAAARQIRGVSADAADAPSAIHHALHSACGAASLIGADAVAALLRELEQRVSAVADSSGKLPPPDELADFVALLADGVERFGAAGWEPDASARQAASRLLAAFEAADEAVPSEAFLDELAKSCAVLTALTMGHESYLDALAAAHSITGSSANVGLDSVQAVGRALERILASCVAADRVLTRRQLRIVRHVTKGLGQALAKGTREALERAAGEVLNEIRSLAGSVEREYGAATAVQAIEAARAREAADRAGADASGDGAGDTADMAAGDRETTGDGPSSGGAGAPPDKAEAYGVFLSEAEELCERVDRALRDNDLAALRGALHTLKVSAATVHLDSVQDAAHLCESALAACRDGAVPESVRALIRQLVDVIGAAVDGGEMPVVPDALVAQLRVATVATPGRGNGASPDAAAADARGGAEGSDGDVDAGWRVDAEAVEQSVMSGKRDHERTAADDGPPVGTVQPPDEVIDDYDEDMLDTFLPEASELCERAEQALRDGDLAALKRTLHTLKGSAGSIRLMSVHEAAHGCESAIAAYRDGELPDTVRSLLHEFIDIVGRAADFNEVPRVPADFLRRLESAVRGEEEGGTPSMPSREPPDPFVERDPAETPPKRSGGGTPARDDAPDDGAGGPSDEERDEWAAEIDGCLSSLRELLDCWDAAADDELCSEILRQAHSLKSATLSLKADALAALAHGMEEVAELARDGRTRPAAAKYALRVGLTAATAAAAALRESSTLDEDTIELCEEARSIIDGLVSDAPDEDDDAAPQAEAAAEEAVPAPEAADAPSADDGAKPDAGAAEEAAAKADRPGLAPLPPRPFERDIFASFVMLDDAMEHRDRRVRDRAAEPKLRVSAGLLDALISYLGDAVVVETRLEREARVGLSRVQELRRSVARLREHLVRMERIIDTYFLLDDPKRFHAESEWDPLLMDRYGEVHTELRLLSEAVDDVAELAEDAVGQSSAVDKLIDDLEKSHRRLRDGLLRARTEPFTQHARRLERTVRSAIHAAQETGEEKEVELVITGRDVEVDRRIYERLVPVLEHVLRNAVVHGIEPAAERERAGKPRVGRIDLVLSRSSDNLEITVRDDGRGVDVEALRAKAVELGLVQASEAEELSRDEVLSFIFASGVSTSKRITQQAGRGVAMEEVARTVSELDGVITVSTEDGKGTEFRITIPLRVAVTQVVTVVADGREYAIPTGLVRTMRLMPVKEVMELVESGGRLDLVGDDGVVHRYPVMLLGDLLGIPGYALPEGRDEIRVVFCGDGEDAVALVIEGSGAVRETSIRPCGWLASVVPGLTGAVVTGSGEIALMLDPPAMYRYVRAKGKRVRRYRVTERKVRRVLVVDDSITIRKIMTKQLSGHGFDVVTAEDGVAALQRLREHDIDIVLLDVEMPRMNGYEFARTVRRSRSWANLPIIMITSRVGQRHREVARQIGVNAYLGKPYRAEELFGLIDRLTGAVRPEGEEVA